MTDKEKQSKNEYAKSSKRFLNNEDEYDIIMTNDALKEYLSNPKTYTLDEIRKELDL